jgi:hypothetical protein
VLLWRVDAETIESRRAGDAGGFRMRGIDRIEAL